MIEFPFGGNVLIFDCVGSVPYFFVIGLSLFSYIFFNSLKRNIEATLENMKDCIDPDTVWQYTVDSHIRLSLISSTMCAFPYAAILIWLRHDKLYVPTWLIVIFLIVIFVISIFMANKFNTIYIGRLVMEKWLSIRKSTWLNIYIICLNIALIIFSCIKFN